MIPAGLKWQVRWLMLSSTVILILTIREAFFK